MRVLTEPDEVAASRPSGIATSREPDPRAPVDVAEEPTDHDGAPRHEPDAPAAVDEPTEPHDERRTSWFLPTVAVVVALAIATGAAILGTGLVGPISSPQLPEAAPLRP